MRIYIVNANDGSETIGVFNKRKYAYNAALTHLENVSGNTGRPDLTCKQTRELLKRRKRVAVSLGTELAYIERMKTQKIRKAG